MARGFGIAVLVTLVAAAGCGSSDGNGTPSCAALYDCPTGESCGTADGTSFQCHAAGALKLGDSCDQSQFLPLQCEDHLACLGMNGSGTCRRWCSSQDPCPSGTGSCTPLRTTLGATLSFCLP